MKNGRMTDAQRAALQKRVEKKIEKVGKVATARGIPITYSTLCRFLEGKPMHESTLQQIAARV
jgi:hypothetical protein